MDLRRQLDRLATNFTADAHSTGPAGGFRMVVISDLPCLREAYPVLDANRNGPGREHGAGDGEDSYVVHQNHRPRKELEACSNHESSKVQTRARDISSN